MEHDTSADAQTLNTLKNRVREMTRVLDTSHHIYPDTLEAAQVKHELAVLLSELRIHGLLPARVHLAPDVLHVCE